MTTSVDLSLSHLLGRLAVIEARVEEAVAHRRQAGDEAPERFRGLYVSDAQVDALLTRPDALRCVFDTAGAQLADEDPASPLTQLSARFGLSDFEVDVLLVALAPDLDPRFEKLYGYLHDDVTRRRASIGLAVELAGGSGLSARSRTVLSGAGPLRRLVVVEDPERPYLTRSLRVPDPVTAFLLGEASAPRSLAPWVRTVPPHLVSEGERLARALGAGGGVVYCRQRGASWAASVTAGALGADRCVVVDVTGSPHPDLVAAEAVRHAALHGLVLVLGPVEQLTMREFDPSGPVVLHGATAWDPAWSSPVVPEIDLTALARADATELWRSALGTDVSLASAVGSFRLAPDQVGRAVAAARLYAQIEQRPLDADLLAAGARAQNGVGLARLARRVQPAATWDDLIVPPATEESLRHLVDRVRWRTAALDRFGLRRGGGRGEGVTALFAGEPGTGKTLAAEVIANALGLDLYVIDLSAVVDKYVGETEKNLEKIFTEAESVNGVLFFDEADALFGRRSAVTDAHDRYANVETSYLLQRMETFDGVAILATNFMGNLDDAFMRRLSVIIDFPRPGVEERRRLWSKALVTMSASEADVDVLAERVDVTGAEIAQVISGLTSWGPGIPPGLNGAVLSAVLFDQRARGRMVSL